MRGVNKFLTTKRPFISAMLYRFTFIVLLVGLLSCGSDSGDSGQLPQVMGGTDLSKFSFLKTHNPGISQDYHLTINEHKITGRISHEAPITNLVASFDHNGSGVYVDNNVQQSGITANDYRYPLNFSVRTSDGRQATYEVNVTYFTQLPIIRLTTDGSLPIDSKEEYREGQVEVYGGREYEDMEGEEMKIKGRGNSTWFMHPKKPFQLKFPEKTGILNMPEDKKWIFLAEYSDKSLIRNTIAFEMGYISNLDWTPESVFSEVFVNGAYNGTYNISQKVEASSNRVDLGDSGYLLEIDQLDRLDPDDVYFRTDRFLINIKEPELTYDSEAYTYAKDLLNEFENVLFSNQFNDHSEGYAKYIDVDSFIDWYLISEITKNQDSKDFSSIFLNVIPGGKIKMGPLWDFDLAFGNVNYSECTVPSGFWVKDHKWYARLFEDQNFKSKVKSRFLYFKENESFILDKMDHYAALLKYAQAENNSRWNLFGRWVWPNPVFYNTHQEEIDHLKDWYKNRMSWLDNAYRNM
jgi:spore coat protein CotH